MEMLEIQGLTKYFGGLAAIWDLNFEVRQQEILGLIGPNGAGKTTLFNTITGFLRLDDGKISFKGERIGGLRPDQIAKKGIVRTFQHSTLFEEGTALWNVMAGFHMHTKTGLWRALFNSDRYRREEDAFQSNAEGILEFMGLGEWKKVLVRNLPHGQKRGLGICLALATKPELLLLDEPATGLTEEERVILMERIKALKEKGISIILVEHNMQVVMGVCDRVVVMNFGRKIAEGAPEEIQENEAVQEAYLGKGY